MTGVGTTAGGDSVEERKIQLLEAEYRRHLSLMRADPAREKEHWEVAEAILWALDKLREAEAK